MEPVLNRLGGGYAFAGTHQGCGDSAGHFGGE